MGFPDGVVGNASEFMGTHLVKGWQKSETDRTRAGGVALGHLENMSHGSEERWG
jgi:hypothetical protein